MIKKNFGYYLLILAVVMFILFFVFNKSSENKDNKASNQTEEDSNYSYIKSYDTVSKAMIKFPIFQNMHSINMINDDHGKNYTDDNGLSIIANVYNNDTDLNAFVDEKESSYQSEMQNLGYTVDVSDVKCQYLCKRYKTSNNNQLVDDMFLVYIQLSNIDLASLSLQASGKELSSEMISSFIENISITNDAKYTIGAFDGNDLILKFKIDNKRVSIKLDSSKYKEIESDMNSNSFTTVTSNTNSNIYLSIRKRVMANNIKDDIDMYYNLTDPGSNVKEIKVDDKIFYEYDMGEVKNYAYIIDDDNALLISSNDSLIDINDFKNIIEEEA